MDGIVAELSKDKVIVRTAGNIVAAEVLFVSIDTVVEQFDIAFCRPGGIQLIFWGYLRIAQFVVNNLAAEDPHTGAESIGPPQNRSVISGNDIIISAAIYIVGFVVAAGDIVAANDIVIVIIAK